MFEPLSQNSSRQHRVLCWQGWERSLIAIVNRIRLKTLPCGILFSSVLVVDKEEPCRTWNVRRERNELMKLNILPLIPICTNLNRSTWCDTSRKPFQDRWKLLENDVGLPKIFVQCHVSEEGGLLFFCFWNRIVAYLEAYNISKIISILRQSFSPWVYRLHW